MMVGIVGGGKVNSISGAVVSAGDSLDISPKNSSKSFAGAGSFKTGDFIELRNYNSKTITEDNDGMDTSIVANN